MAGANITELSDATFAEEIEQPTRSRPGASESASIPTLLFFRDGKVVDGVVGALPKTALDQRFRAAADSPAGCAHCA